MDNNNTLSICHPVDMQVPLMLQGQSKPGPGNQDLHQEEKGKKMMLSTALRQKLHYLPVITPIFILGTFLITYCISVAHGHVEFVLPYISYTAVHAPARGIFGQLVNLGAILLAANIYIRYLQIAEVFRLREARWRYKRTNDASLGVGCVSALGFMMVANFQTVEMRYVHYTGAGLAFLLGVAYIWLQTYLSLRLRRRGSRVTLTQLVLTIITTVFLIIFICSKVIYKVQKYQGVGTKWDKLRGVYLTSTISEWLTAASIVVYVLTFYQDFSRFQLNMPTASVSDMDAVKMDFDIEAGPDAELRRPIFKKAANMPTSKV